MHPTFHRCPWLALLPASLHACLCSKHLHKALYLSPPSALLTYVLIHDLSAFELLLNRVAQDRCHPAAEDLIVV